jgi:pimeloyl-ACP methyl ester carboxylesterase
MPTAKAKGQNQKPQKKPIHLSTHKPINCKTEIFSYISTFLKQKSRPQMDPIFQKYVNDASRFIMIDGCLIHYRDEGIGIPVICLHGSFSSLQTFEGWVEKLSSHLRLISVDLPGHGLSGPHPQHDYSVKSSVKIVRELMLRLKPGAAVIAGSSLGGWVAWEFALKHPELTSQLILIDSAGFIEADSVPLPFRMARTPFLNRVVKFAIKKQVIERYLNQVYASPEIISSDLISRYYELFSRESNMEAFFHFVNKTEFIDHTPQLREIKVPTLIIWGEEDQWIPVAYGHRFVNSIPDAELVVFEHTGHVPMEELPGLTSTEVANFILKGNHRKQIA